MSLELPLRMACTWLTPSIATTTNSSLLLPTDIPANSRIVGSQSDTCMMPSYTTPEDCDVDGDDEEDEEKNDDDDDDDDDDDVVVDDDDDDDNFIGLLRFSRGLYRKAFTLVPPIKYHTFMYIYDILYLFCICLYVYLTVTISYTYLQTGNPSYLVSDHSVLLS